MWYYETRVGTFNIRKQSNSWSLWIGSELLGTYNTPGQAADDVYTQSTGYYPWDSLPPVKSPYDLSEWTQGE